MTSAPLGPSRCLLGALGHLARDEALPYSDLARRARVTAQSVQATVGHLVDLGAVSRRTDDGPAADRRRSRSAGPRWRTARGGPVTAVPGGTTRHARAHGAPVFLVSTAGGRPRRR